MFGQLVDFSLDLVATRQLSFEQQEFPQDPVLDEQVGGFGSPAWRAIGNFRATTGPWSLFWRTNYIDSQGDFDSLTGQLDLDTAPDGRYQNTFNGRRTGSVSGVEKVPAYFEHTLSFRYQEDTWSALFGVANVLDRDPPQVDDGAGDDRINGATIGNWNVPLGVGYDQRGRRFFATVTRRF
ncbi:MAG: hypothetical protein AAFV51_13320 [Pseudomonadota bacterium]